MTERYYICNDEEYIGPLDMIMMLRKIRSGIITGQTIIKSESNQTPAPACSFPELVTFLHQDDYEEQTPANAKYFSFSKLIENGWYIVTVEPITCVVASAILILLFILNIAVANLTENGVILTLINIVATGWIQTLFMVMMLRINRGQRISSTYIKHELKPAFLPILCTSTFISIAMSIGGILFILPGVLIASLFAYAPFLIIDKNLSVIDALKVSAKHMRNSFGNQFMMACLLTGFYMLFSLLILTYPLLLPIYASAMAELYDHSK